MRKITFLTGFGAGYVLGARAGRERYEQLMQAFDSFRANPKVQQTMSQVQDQASTLAQQAKEKVGGGGNSSTDPDVIEVETTSYAGGTTGTYTGGTSGTSL